MKKSHMRAANDLARLQICAVSPVLADCAKKKARAKLYIPTHVIKVLIAYASSKRPDKPAHSHSLSR